MKKFTGFPARIEFTPIPNPFFSSLLPQIGDIAELKVTLFILGALYRKRGYPRFVTYRELLGNVGLMSSLGDSGTAPEEALRQALEKTTRRGTLLHIVLEKDKVAEDVYLLNSEQDRQAVAKIKGGELHLSGLKVKEVGTEIRELPDIFTLYEQNIGMLTPMIAEELKEAERLYPVAWIEEAFKEAVSLNKRNWRYIAAILERWSAEGKSDGTFKRDSQKKTGPDKYLKGKYGHMVRY